MDNEVKVINEMAIMTTYFLNKANELQTNSRFKHNLKKWGNKFINEIGIFEKLIYRDQTEKELLELSEQMHNNSIAVENILTIVMNLKNDNQRDYFNTELEQIAVKFNINIKK